MRRLGAAAPVADTSGLTQPNGQVPAGSTAIIVANTVPFPVAGGWAIVGNGEQAISTAGSRRRAHGDSGDGHRRPGGGRGVQLDDHGGARPGRRHRDRRDDAKGSSIHIWVQRDDLAAQAAMMTLDGGGDGIYEHIVSDDRRSEASLMQVCDAELELYSRPLVTVTYAARDTKTKSGKTVTIAIASPAIAETLTIQDVIDYRNRDDERALRPKYGVTASSVRHSFDAILRQLIRKTEA